MEEVLSTCLPPACPAGRAGRPGAQKADGDEKKPGRVCAVCGGALGRRQQKYCSETCAAQGRKEYLVRYYKEKWEKERAKRHCAVCGGELGRGQQKYCSAPCAAQGKREYFANYMRARRGKKDRRCAVCAVCGAALGYKKIKYCDVECREKAVKQRLPDARLSVGQGRQGRVCVICGGELGYRERKYCSEKCREIGQKKQGHNCPVCGAVVHGRQRCCENCAGEKKEKKRRVCAVCGGELGYRQRKFCSADCARKGKQEREKKWRERKKDSTLPESKAPACRQAGGEEKTGKLCVICGKEVGRKKYKYCSEQCAGIGKKRIDAEALGRRLRACEKCGAWSVTGKFSLCVACRTAEREKKKIKIGGGHACRKCGAIIFVKRYYCESCREEKRAEEEKKKEGRCKLCGEEVKRGKMCEACRTRKRKEESLKLSVGDHIGKCPACGKEDAQIDAKEGLCVGCALKKIRSYKKTVGQMRSDTLCWQCKNAVPKIAGGRYVAGCPWSVRRRPVPGWDAQKRKLDGGRTESYHVKACPGFVEG